MIFKETGTKKALAGLSFSPIQVPFRFLFQFISAFSGKMYLFSPDHVVISP
jgi:hypothetical protein